MRPPLIIGHRRRLGRHTVRIAPAGADIPMTQTHGDTLAEARDAALDRLLDIRGALTWAGALDACGEVERVYREVAALVEDAP